MKGTAVEEIKAKLEIVPLISEYTQVKKAGASFMAICPFHHEKTPSLHISPDKQMWYCHGCGEGGDIFGFVMRSEGLDFLDTLRLLARKAGVTLDKDDAKANTERQVLMAINGLAAKYYHEVLLRSPQAAQAREYVAKRQISKETAEDFLLGFAPDSWDATVNFLKKREYKEDQVYRAGLASKSDRGKGYFDRFRGRLMFPIRDAQGNVVGFTARIMPGPDGKDSKDEAKYINTSQTPIYNKSHVLYGLDAARKDIKKQDLAVVVEGNMDVIASHQAGVKNVVASSGTSFTAEQLGILKRFTSRLVLSFDADAAGENAARRSIDAAVGAGFAVRILRIPAGAGKDPDDCIKKDPAMWHKAIADAVPYMEWYLSLVAGRTDFKNPDAMREASEALLREIAKMDAPVERSHWIRKVGEMFDTPESALFEQVQRMTARAPRPAITPQGSMVPGAAGAPAQAVGATQTIGTVVPKSVTKRTRHEVVSRHVFALGLTFPELTETVIKGVSPEFLADENRELYSDFAASYTDSRQSGREPAAYRQTLLHAGNRELADSIAFLELLAEKEYGELASDVRREALAGLIGELKQLHKGRRQRELTHAMHAAEQAGDMAKIQTIQSQIAELMLS